MADKSPPACIYVLAGTNGAGKSSVGGAMLREKGATYFNPDEAARRILAANPGITLVDANSAAWKQGKRLLERAISERCTFAFETTLGGNTITALLEKAAAAGIEVRIWYVGLNSVDLHIERVRARVAAGGHDIPEAKIRERYISSRLNLIRLLRVASEVRVFDNSAAGDPHTGHRPAPLLIVHMENNRIITSCELSNAPEWAKSILAEALSLNT